VEQELSDNEDEVLLVQFQKGIETTNSQAALDKSRVLLNEMKAIIGEPKWQNGESTVGNICNAAGSQGARTQKSSVSARQP
jgi:hypothetical protein